MNPKHYYLVLCKVSALMVAGAMLFPAPALAQVAASEDVQILTRGPVHEAFAESVSFDPEPGIIILGRPPEMIEELPPEQQPEGDNVTWIPGYWAWDDDQNDFIWISGIWRNLPPGRQWIPGYWSDIEDGKSQWTSGYWADATETEVSYISTPPPRNVDVGPNIAAPSEDHNWIPGNWYWTDARYVWRPGYWVPLRTNWTWVPARYCWTGRGYVYIDGYWDYAVARRGVLFAPVYFRDYIYRRPNYYYTPSIVVALNVFSSHLFIRPRSCHYYFGDYYAPRYRESGYYASFSWYSGRRGYDPIYAYDRWDHRHDRDWERRRSDDYKYFRDNEKARPPHTWAAMKDYREDRYSDGRNRTYASSLSDYTKDSKSGQAFHKVDDDRRKQFVSQRQDMRKLREERSRVETGGKTSREDSRRISSREKLTRSPIVGREAESFSEKEAPPKRPEARGGKTSIKDRLEAREIGKDLPADAKKRPTDTTGRKTERPESPREKETAGKDEKAESPRSSREEGADKPELRKPSSRAEVTRDTSEKKPSDAQRERLSKPDVRPVPERKEETAPKREDRPNIPHREGRSKPETRPVPERREEVVPKREVSPSIPQRESRSKPETRPVPERKEEVAPKREARPSIPQRETRPNPETRSAPERRVEIAPKREVRPSTPQRETRPNPETRSAPERRVEVAPKREVRPSTPQRETRQVPERREQPEPRREVQPAPQPRSTPKSESSRSSNRPDESGRSSIEEELKRRSKR